jgi:hypothetical protein
MAASSAFMIAEAGRHFPVRVRTGIPPDGLGYRLDGIKAWLDENCGANRWAMTPSGTRGVLDDALSIFFADATLASAFVARWCAGYSVEAAGGVFQVREDDPTPRVGVTLHRTPRAVQRIPMEVSDFTQANSTSTTESESPGKKLESPIDARC